MKIFIEKQNKEITLAFKGKVSELLGRLNLAKDAVLVTRDNSLLTEDEELNDKDCIRIFTVVSGG